MVLAPAERQVPVGPAERIECVRIRLLRRTVNGIVTVGRGEPDRDCASGGNLEIAESGIFASEERLHWQRGSEPEYLFDKVPHRVGVAGYIGGVPEEIGLGEKYQSVGEAGPGGIGAGSYEAVEVVEQLRIVDLSTVPGLQVLLSLCT